MRLTAGAYWGIGKREQNQDTIVYQQVLTREGRVAIAIVGDGVGSLDKGAYASGFAAEQMVAWFYDHFLPLICQSRWGRGKKGIERSCYRALYQIYESLHLMAVQNGLRMGTTFTLLLLWKRKYLLLHLGDSRLYLLRNRRLRQLTTDHVHESGALRRCLNSSHWQVPEQRMGKIRRKDCFLLCTDGFRRVMSTDIIAEILSDMDKGTGEKMDTRIGRRLQRIAEYSLKKGELDNSSAIFIRTG